MTVIEEPRTTIRSGTIGDSPVRPDGVAKVQGTYAFSSDLHADGCLFGATLRSPHPHARIVAIDLSAAWKLNGVEAVITAEDVPGQLTYGLIAQDQPVFAVDVVRYVGEPIAAVAAIDPETARRALDAIEVTYEVLTPLLDPEAAIAGGHDPIHPDGNLIRHQHIVHGDPSATGAVVVEGTYEIGMQDQAFLGLEAAIAYPDPGADGVELHVATQWLHEDQKQIAACLGFADEKVRMVLGGVGGAFGAREDISLQVHTCLLALRLARPVRMAYSRAESFLGHVHRHPATIWMRHHADADGRLVNVEARFVFDGGAYASTSSAVLVNGITMAQGPYACPNGMVDGYAARTNHLPCGAMRGFGAVQACFAYESQMDKLAAACGVEPAEIRLRNAMKTGDTLFTGQPVLNVAPVEDCIRETMALPLPDEPVGGTPLSDGSQDAMKLPGGAGRTADAGDIVRGIGWGVSIKNLMYSENFDDYSTARCRLADGVATLKFATAEVGQGFITIAAQIARSILGVDEVELDQIDTHIGSAGSTSASRQTWMSGGAVDAACRAARERLFEAVGTAHGIEPIRLMIEGTDVIDTAGDLRIPVVEASSGLTIDETIEYHHPPTEDLDENGQGNCHTAFAFVAHRAVVDVDPELGLVKVVQIATAQDVGNALNPLSVVGQIEGGIAQGLGLAVMEEIIQIDGVIRNGNFTDYLLPTFLDMPPVLATLIEQPDPHAPLGAKGVGEPPCISSTPAVVAAIRDALRQAGIDAPLDRVPVRPADICL
ncbi:molybdopterin cofactor-binding domain-containing protein [Ilumatobacter nonamiensis]|uniref:molybdopterin cofactor-binding domain-containing protein n=1 Tax=Ilumatobacter nonamiensis TaxID=467093 RepID=UPI00034A5513|nr:molybdopterin cofactor-binding domain-containing protein [Ilumatobacter nonamiensis]